MRLIDADELAQGMIWVGEQTDGATSILANRLARLLKDDVFAPTIDAVPVVRCWECKHRGDAAVCPMCHTEWYYDDDDGNDCFTVDQTDDDGFCQRGAKMDGCSP